MNIVKNKLRNKMLLPMLSAILTVKYGMERHDKCCKNFELANAVIKKIGAMESYDPKKLPNKKCLHFQVMMKFCWRYNSKSVW